MNLDVSNDIGLIPSNYIDILSLKDLEIKIERLINWLENFSISEIKSKIKISNLSLNLILYYLINTKLPEINYKYFKLIKSFFEIDIIKILKKENQIINLSIGFTFLFEEPEILEVCLLCDLLKRHKLAKITLIKKFDKSHNCIINIVPNYLWYYLETQLIKKNFEWINELLWLSKRRYNNRETNDLQFQKSKFDKRLDAYFWIKLFLYSDEFEKNRDYDDLKKYYIAFLNKFKTLTKYLIGINKEPAQMPKDYSNKFYKFNGSLIKKLKEVIKNFELAEIDRITQKSTKFNEIPLKHYKPDFTSKFSINLNMEDEKFINRIPEMYLFQLITPNPSDLYNDLKKITSETDLTQLVIKLLIYRYYEIVFEEDLLDNNKFQFVKIIRNLLNYKIWDHISERKDYLENYWKKYKDLWIYDYYKLEGIELNKQKKPKPTEFNSLGFFETLKQFIECYNYIPLSELFKSELIKLSIPMKVFTEFLLKNEKFVLRDEKIKKLNSSNVILVILDGLSYTAAKRFQFEESYEAQIEPVIIEGLTKSQFQISKIWDSLSQRKNIEVCEDTSLASDLLFPKIQSLNTYIIDNGFHKLLIEYQNKISDFYNSNNFYFVYIANNESLNQQISEDETFIDRYERIIKKIIKDIHQISEDNNVELYFTSDHGSILVEENSIFSSLYKDLVKPLKEIFNRRKTSRALFLNREVVKESDKNDLKILSSLLIRNKNNQEPQFSLPPKIILSKKRKYDHSGISLEENLVPWIKIIFRK